MISTAILTSLVHCWISAFSNCLIYMGFLRLSGINHWNKFLERFNSLLRFQCILLLRHKVMQGLWAPDYDTKTGVHRVSGGRHSQIGHFYDLWIGRTRVRTWRRNKGPQQRLVRPWTLASNTHQQSRGKRNQYRLILCPSSIRYIRPWRRNKKRQERERVQEETRRRREQWSAFWRLTLLPIVIGQLPSLPLIHNANVLSIRDLLL